MQGSDRTLKTTRSQDETTGAASIPCPLCGCLHHIEDTITASPRFHTLHQCLRCGCWFDNQEAVCSRCGTAGEFLGNVIAPGLGLYAQYRCRGCGHGFMIQITTIDGHKV